MTAAFQVGPETLVSLRYEVRDAEGETVDASEEPVEFVFGIGQLLPALEQAIEGLVPGATKRVRVAPEQAYGRRDPAALIEVDRAEFPDDVQAGDRFEAENEQGGLVVLRVLEVTDEVVVVDTNHPLADQTVSFDVEIVGVRPASEVEISAAVARLAAEDQAVLADPTLIPPGRLLRGRLERYETSANTDPEPAGDSGSNGSTKPA